MQDQTENNVRTATAVEGEEGPDVRLNGPSWAVVVAVSLAGLASLALSLAELHTEDFTAIAILVVMAMGAERFDLDLYVDSRVSLAVVPIIAAVFIAGIAGAVIVAAFAILASAIGVRVPWYKTAFNLGALVLASAASALIVGAFGPSGQPGAWPEVLIPAGLAVTANFVVNAGLITAIIALSTGASPGTVWKDHFMWLWPHYLVLGFLGVVIAAANDAMGLLGILAFFVPLVMMRVSIKQYLDKTTEGVLELRRTHGELQVSNTQLTEALQTLDNAYDGTLRSLVAALDARDSETGGHSERVAELAVEMAEEMGISRSSDQGRIIAWGALLHDVGKIAVPDAILRKPGSLSDEEWVPMRKHARAGYDIIQSVKFLAPAAEIVLAHHERYDGAGYPRGLAGEDIPLGARIFMIADTFDAITSERPYKAAIPAEEALAEILRNSGTQFDPACVELFLAVYRKRFVVRGTSGSPGGHGTGRLSPLLERAVAEAVAKLERSE